VKHIHFSLSAVEGGVLDQGNKVQGRTDYPYPEGSGERFQRDSGLPEVRVAEQTVYRCSSRYGGSETSELQRLRELEAENSRLKWIVAQQALDIDVLKEVVSRVVGLDPFWWRVN
jgi:hypothetical protein